MLSTLLSPTAFPLHAQNLIAAEESVAKEVVTPSGNESIARTPSVSPYNRSFFVISNLSLWFLWAILIIVMVILISLRKVVFERRANQGAVHILPRPEEAPPVATPLVEPKKVVTIKVRKVSKRKPKQHASPSKVIT